MKWSQLPRRKQQMYVGVAVVAAAALTIVGLANNSKKQVGADTPGATNLTLDSAADLSDLTFRVVNAAGTAQSGAYLDLFSQSTEEGYTNAADQDGAVSFAVPADCYVARATDADSAAEATVTVAFGVDAAECGADALATKAGETVTVTIK